MGYCFLVDNTDECTSIKTYAFTYNPLILQHVSICSHHAQGEQIDIYIRVLEDCMLKRIF